MEDYHINIFYSKEDGRYIADIPDLRCCSAVGLTPQAALHELLIAEKVYRETCKARDLDLPLPRFKSTVYAVAAFVEPTPFSHLYLPLGPNKPV